MRVWNQSKLRIAQVVAELKRKGESISHRKVAKLAHADKRTVRSWLQNDMPELTEKSATGYATLYENLVGSIRGIKSMQDISLELENFCGISAASLEWQGICLVAGKNKAGKTSIAKAVQLLLTDRKMPDDTPQKESKAIIKEGARTASARISVGDEHRRLDWFEKDVKADGTLFQISDVAAGLLKPAELPQKDRAALLIKLLKASPDEDQFTKAFAAAGATVELTTEYWKKITKGSFDVAFTAAEQNGQYLKRKFKELTGCGAWGVDMMSKWLIPDERLAHIEWTPEQHRELLEKSALKLQQARVANMARTVLTEENRIFAARIDEFRELVSRNRVELKRLNGDKETAYSFMMKAKHALNVPERLHCPCCKTELAMLEGKLAIPPKEEGAKDLLKEQAAFHQKAYEDINEKIQLLSGERMAYEVNLKRAEQTAETIAKAEAASKDAGAGDIPQLELAVKEAQTGEAAYKRYAEAVDLDQQIRLNEKVKTILAPEGLRRQVMSARLEDFNEKVLGTLCTLADCGSVRLDEHMNITFQSRYKFASGAESFFKDVILQIALSHLADDPLIIIDHDVSLDADSKLQLFKLLSSPGVRKRCASLVCLVANDRSQVPDLGGKGLGLTVWVEKGEISALKQPVSAR